HLETGGELYGAFLRDGNPLVMLCTPAGKEAVHRPFSFQQDYQYFLYNTNILQKKHGIQFLGTEHSHHYLSLKYLSGLDVQNSNIIARKNNFQTLYQILLTFENNTNKENHYSSNTNHVSRGKKNIQIRSYYYPDAIKGGPVKCPIRIIPGISPIRQAIENDPDLSEIVRPSHFPLSRIVYDEYKTNTAINNSIPNPIQGQLKMFLKTYSNPLSMSFEDGWIIIKIALLDDLGSLFIVFNYHSPFDIQSIFYQADFISKSPVNISSEILKGHHAPISLNFAYDRGLKIILKHFTAKKRRNIYDTL
ncbi:MAG: hypothetical protein PF503_04375, partial [Desulfobacula sp.]|nr:hypothetical protein [Desulfobacula sp.]